MASEVLINVGPAETRVAFVEQSRLSELFLERTVDAGDGMRAGRGGHRLLGNIMLGRVQRVLPGMQAAFVDLGLEKAGFLAAREARCLADLPSFMDQPCISKCVREGEAVVVQVIKDPISEKGARLSANVTIPGRLVVLVPNQSGVALSRRIEDETERARLTEIMTDIATNDPRAAARRRLHRAHRRLVGDQGRHRLRHRKAGRRVAHDSSAPHHGQGAGDPLPRSRSGRAHHARRRRRGNDAHRDRRRRSGGARPRLCHARDARSARQDPALQRPRRIVRSIQHRSRTRSAA